MSFVRFVPAVRGLVVLFAACWASLLTAGSAHASFTKTANTSTYTAAGEVITYTYVYVNNNTDVDNVAITDDKVDDPVNCGGITTVVGGGGVLTCTGTYTIKAADVVAGSVTNTATLNATETGDPVMATATFTIRLRGANNNAAVTRLLIGQFLTHRANLLALHEPDRPRLLRRSPGLLWGEAKQADTTPFSFSGDAAGTQLSFASSVMRMSRAKDAAETAELDKALGLGPKLKRTPKQMVDAGWDAWVEAHFSGFGGRTGAGNFDGYFGIVYVGADYLVNPSLLLGVLAQFDSMSEKQKSLNAALKGQGTMAGPYLSVRLPQDLFLDMRAAWGRSSNRISPDGTFEDRFSTDRWLASGKLTTNRHWNQFRITPSAGAIFVSEHQHSYIDSLANVIPSQSVSLGRFTFGPEIAYRYTTPYGTIFEPQLALNGIWDFYKTDLAAVQGLTSSTDRIFAGAKAALMARSPGGAAIRVSVSYDGIAARNFHDLGGQIWASIPLR